MIKRFCDKCGREIGNKKGMGVKLFPLDDSHEPDFIDLCSDCQWKFVEWIHGLNSKDTKVIYIKSEDDFPNGPLTKEEEAEQAIPKTLYDLELPARVNNRLYYYLNKDREKRIPITDISVEEVLNLTEEELFAIPGIGPKSIADVIHKLEKYGWKLREEEENKPVDVSGITWD